jgi:hypothetical protein
MNAITVTAPISIDELKKYFSNKETSYIIDYHNSKLREAKLLTYLGNLDLPVDIDLTTIAQADLDELMVSYFNLPIIISVPSLEKLAIYILAEAKGILETDIYGEFINSNRELIDSWISKVDSLTLYNMYILNSEEMKNFVRSHQEDNTKDVSGINFVSLLKHEVFYTLYQKIEKKNLRYYSTYFDEYMFKGKNLYSFWANEFNPMFLLTYGISNGLVNGRTVVEGGDVSSI